MVNRSKYILLLVFILNLFINQIQSIETKSNNFFSKISNLNSDTFTCEETPRSDNLCINRIQASMSVKFYHCNTTNGDFCYSHPDTNDDQIYCEKIKKFVGDSCTENEECFTDNCKGNKCAYKEDGSTCKLSLECGKDSFCLFNSNCQKYVLEENGTCSYNYPCSPQFYCTNDKKCVKKGTIDDGFDAEDSSLCKSFKKDNKGKCTSTYGTTADDKLKSALKDYFPKINWEGKKLSSFEGDNMGSLEILNWYPEEYLKYTFKDAETSKCAAKTFTEEQLLNTGLYTLNEEDMKTYLHTEPEKPKKENTGLKTGAIILIIIGVVLFLGGIGFAIYYFVCKKPKADLNTSEIGSISNELR